MVLHYPILLSLNPFVYRSFFLSYTLRLKCEMGPEWPIIPTNAFFLVFNYV